MKIYTERVYDAPEHEGYRVLADRLWPRGMTKQKAKLDEWDKTVAPSSELRKWFGHDPEKWTEFSKRYRNELKAVHDEAKALLKRAGKGPLILLSGAKDTEHTHTLVLKDYLSRLA